MCKRYFVRAGTARSATWMAIAGNTGNMMSCYQLSVASSKKACLDLGETDDGDERGLGGG